MAEKVTTMVLKVDLQCTRCYKKVKKVLCKFPQIRNQIYDEKANTVTITVVCCSPEKIRDKVCYKGGGSIKSIEIKPAPPARPPPATAPPPPAPAPAAPPLAPKKEPPQQPMDLNDPEKNKPKGTTKPQASASLSPVPYAVRFPCPECYHGHGRGPRYFDGPPPPSFPCYGTPVYDSWGGGGGYKYGYASRGDCLSDENPQACSIM